MRPDATPFHVGRRAKCPGCGFGTAQWCKDCKVWTGDVCHKCGYGQNVKQVTTTTDVTACQPGRRIRLKPWWRFARCAESGNHLHQSCIKCGLSWIVAPAEPI